MTAPVVDRDGALCARCRVNPRVHRQTGCLCQPCEDAIEGMTQEQLDEDYRAHTAQAGKP